MKIYLWGDSIGKGVIFNEDRKRYCLAKDRCINRLEAIGECVENHARMGATIMDGWKEFRDTPTERGSVVVIEYGGNDCDLDWDAVSADPTRRQQGRTDLPAFSMLLKLFVRESYARGLRPLLVTPPPLCAGKMFDWVCQNRDREAILSYLGDVEHIYRWQERYARAVMDVAYQTGCPVCDVRSILLEEDHYEDLVCLDGIHPNEAGHLLIAEAVMNELDDLKSVLGA